MTVPLLFDPGLQPERTELAWRRTALAVAVGSLISLRVLPLMLPQSAAWGLAPGVLGLLAACGIWGAARRRQLRLRAALRKEAFAGVPGGGLLLALTVLCAAFGVLAAVLLILSVRT